MNKIFQMIDSKLMYCKCQTNSAESNWFCFLMLYIIVYFWGLPLTRDVTGLLIAVGISSPYEWTICTPTSAYRMRQSICIIYFEKKRMPLSEHANQWTPKKCA